MSLIYCSRHWRPAGLVSMLVLTLALLAVAPLPAGAAATLPAATVTLSSSPVAVPPGATVTITGTLTNTSSQTERVSVDYVVTGPANFTDHYTVNATLQAGETRTASRPYTAPAPPGTYTVTATVRAASTVLARATTTFDVQ